MYNTIEASFFKLSAKNSPLRSLTDEDERSTFQAEITIVGQRLGVASVASSSATSGAAISQVLSMVFRS